MAEVLHEVADTEAGTRVALNEENQVREVSYVDQPWASQEESPLLAAIDYLRQHLDLLSIDPAQLENPHEKISFSEPREQGVVYRLGQQKELFDSSTIIFNQTYLNVPVWRAALTVTLKHKPNRVVTVIDTSERGIDAPLPPADRIEAHRTVFALAAADQRLASLGLADKSAEMGLALEDQQPATAAFLRIILGRGGQESGEEESAGAIRGRFFVYRYRAVCRFPADLRPTTAPEEPDGANKDEAEGEPVYAPAPEAPRLDLPPVEGAITEGAWRLVSEVTFTMATAEGVPLSWRALVDVQTDSVLMLEPLASGLNGLVFPFDPITATGNSSLTPNQANAVLNPHKQLVALANLDAPAGGLQELRGRFAVVSDVNAPAIAPPTQPANTDFSYDVRTNDFAAVNAYFHTDRFFAVVEGLGFPISSYFDNTSFPVRVDHRDSVGGSANTINAHCVGNGHGGIGYAGYALNDLTNTAQPIGRACDSRVHFHELGGHGILYEHVDHPNFGFCHSAGDSLSAIFHDPDSQAQDRFRYAPWNPVNTRRFDRAVTAGWAWGGTMDDRQYGSEQILATTLFRVYLSIGGGSDDVERRRFASRVMMYLILRAVSTLTPATNPGNALGFANALMAADVLDWTSAGLPGGAYNKVIRWSFEKQGLYQPPGAPTPVAATGAPPKVDVYIDDGRKGEYPFQPVYWNNKSIWNRVRADGRTTHQQPVRGRTNHAYLRLANRGTAAATNVRVRAFHHKPGGGTAWPTDFTPLQTPGLAVAGSIGPNSRQSKVVGPFAWTPNLDAAGNDSLLMVVSADGDPSNVEHFSAQETIPEWRLVPHDNNIGLRSFALSPSGEQQVGVGDAAAEPEAIAAAEELLNALGLAGRKARRTSIRDVTIRIELEDE